MAKAQTPLGELLATHTREGTLYEHLPEGRVRCFACGHRCLIPPGFDGICRVRFNEGGRLLVPHGYVGALQVDPIEKKPFFHALPGAQALSFGMLGCDYHCGYCFDGETSVVTEAGPLTFAALFEACERKEETHDATLAHPQSRLAVTAEGRLRRIKGVVRHRYRGEMVVVTPRYLPAVECTPDHRLFVASHPDQPPQLKLARDVVAGEYLAVPHARIAGDDQSLDVLAVLATVQVTHRVPYRLTRETREEILVASAAGESSRSIGLRVGMSSSHVRHVRSRAARGADGPTRTRTAVSSQGRVRFAKEHGAGIPASLPVDADLAALLGYYCAEGCVSRSKARPNSHNLSFSFARDEMDLAERVRGLLHSCLGVEGRLVWRETTLAVCSGKTSAALLLKLLAGDKSTRKKVPEVIAASPPPILRAFLDAYVEGDGHRYPNGKVMVTTVSRALADGVAWLVLRCGGLASIYATPVAAEGRIQGRAVRRAGFQYSVVWYPAGIARRGAIETPNHFLVPLRAVGRRPHDGYVYNMEVEEDHSYLAGFLAVSNCQNWMTSQALRDANAVAPPREMSAAGLVGLAARHGARVLTSTYNEPLITSEWAVEVFRPARAAGLVCSYVSNGNGTPEVLDFIRPWVSLYKVDLKSFRDRHYRELGGTLERVLWTIRALHQQGFWLEIVTLVIPGFNDSNEELTDIARFLVSVSPDVPWHVTAFHQDYRMTDPDATPVATLLRACEIGKAAGLRYVYAGNLPGRVGEWENTRCPHCGALLVERVGYRIRQDRLQTGACPDCGRVIAGFWEPQLLALNASGDTRAVRCWPENETARR